MTSGGFLLGATLLINGLFAWAVFSKGFPHIHWRHEVGEEYLPEESPIQLVMIRRRCRCGSETLRRDPDSRPIPKRLADVLRKHGAGQ